MKKIEDISLDYVKVYYRAANGKLNKHFDKAIRDICKEYGLKFWASGMEMETRKRDLNFERR